MKITHIGAKNCVTGSCHLVQTPTHPEAGGVNLLVDCGIAQGRAIVEGRTPSKAAIHRLTGYSAHADQQTLCDWVAAMPEPPGEIRLVHGEPRAKAALANRIRPHPATLKTYPPQ